MKTNITSLGLLCLGLAALSNTGCASYMEKTPVNEPTTHLDRARYCAERATSDRAKSLRNSVAGSVMTGGASILAAASASSFIVAARVDDGNTRNDAIAVGAALLAGSALTLLTKAAFGLERREAEYAASAANRDQAANRLASAKESDNTDRVFDDCVAQYPAFGIRMPAEVQPSPNVDLQVVIPEPPTEYDEMLKVAQRVKQSAQEKVDSSDKTLVMATSAHADAESKQKACTDKKPAPPTPPTPPNCDSEIAATRKAQEAVEAAKRDQTIAQRGLNEALVGLADINLKIATWQLAKVEAISGGTTLQATAQLRYDSAKAEWLRASQLVQPLPAK